MRIRRLGVIMILLAAAATAGVSAGGEVLWETTLTEHLGYAWTNEFLHYRLAVENPLPSACHLEIAAPGGPARTVAVQVLQASGETPAGRHVYDLYCVASLGPYQTLRLQLLTGKGPPALNTPLAVESDGKTITASSGAMDIQVPDSIKDGRGLSEAQIPLPLLRFRNTRQNGWAGGGGFSHVGELAELRTRVTTCGPVFADIEMEYVFSVGRYRVTLRLIRDQPLVLWSEETRHDDPRAMLTWNVAAGMELAAAYPFPAKDRQGKQTMAAVPIQSALSQGYAVYPAHPWVELWKSVSFPENKGPGIPAEAEASGLASLDNEGVPDSHDPALGIAIPGSKPVKPEWTVGLFSGQSRDWRIIDLPRDSSRYWWSLIALRVATNMQAVVDLPLYGGKRSFGLAVDDKMAQTSRRSIQYGQTPLDEVKEYVLDYEQDRQDTFPRRLFDETARRACAEALGPNSPFHADIGKAQVACAAALASPKFKEVSDWLNTWDLTTLPVWGPWKDRDLIVAALYARDDTLAPLLRAGAMASARKFAYHFLEPIPSDRTWVSTWFAGELGISVVDSGSRYLTPEAFRRVRARMLFLAYKLASDTFEYSRSGRGAPLNMCRTHVNGFLGSIALLYPHHPQAREWVETAKKEMGYELAECNGPNGGWVEAPHYMTVSMDYLLAFALGLARAGDEDLLYNERLKQTVSWLARICTPRDPRYGNRRHFPEIGNTYRNEGTVLFSLMARVYRERDPACADALQWMWHEMGRPMWFHIGGTVPLTEGYREALVDLAPAPGDAPAWKSEWFRDSGVVLRSHFATDRENYLYLIQGNMHEHYDKDNGSIMVWGKGRPLCEDWGYNCGPGGPVQEHSRMDIGGEGQVTEFSALDAIDYVHSRQGPWDRQILFMKDADPLGPNYSLIRDSTAVSGTNTWGAGVTPFRLWPTSPYAVGTGTNEWRLWVNIETNSQLAADARLITARGRDDVDMDIWFDDASLKRLTKIRETPTMKNAPGASGRGEESPSAGKDAEDLDRLLADSQAKEKEAAGQWVYDARRHTVWVITGDNKGYWGSSALEQREILMNVPRGQNVVTVLYARLRGEKKPEVRSFANDRVLKIVSPAGTDWAFLSLGAMEVEAEGVRFKGTVGSVQQRQGGEMLSLGASGEIAGKSFGMSANAAASLRVGKDELTIQLGPDFPGGQVGVMAPPGYEIGPGAAGIKRGRREGGWYVCEIPAGVAGFSMKK